MRVSRYLIALVAAAPTACLSQAWEFGGAGGYGWYSNPAISGPPPSAEAGLPNRANRGVVLGENLYKYLGGEVRYPFPFDGPQLRSDGPQTNTSGYTNVIVYDFLLHMRSKEERLRPFVAGVKVFTSSGNFFVGQPLEGFAGLVDRTQVEPAISAGAEFVPRARISYLF
jgi:hypothetical protein